MSPADRRELRERAQESDAGLEWDDAELYSYGGCEDPAPWDRRERTRAASLRVPLRTAARISPA